MKIWICINKSDGSIAGTWGPASDGPPPDTDVQQFVDAADFPGVTPGDRLLDIAVAPVDAAEPEGLKRVTATVIKATVADVGRLVDAREFLLLFTADQRRAMRALAAGDPDVDDLLQVLLVPVPLRLKDPVTQRALQLLVRHGVLTEPDMTRISSGEPPIDRDEGALAGVRV